MQPSPLEPPDVSSDILRTSRQTLDRIFAPRSVAVIGATETPNSWGRRVLWNLVSSPFGGTVFPVNAKRSSVLGIKTYPAIGDVPEQVDLAVIVNRAPLVPGIIAQCVESGVPGAIIISSSFDEVDYPVERFQAEIRQASQGRIRIIGPNCLGLMNPLTGLNASFAVEMAQPGSVAFLSESRALSAAILDWSIQEQVGFSAFVSLGAMFDIGWGDVISYLGEDPRTQSILIYMESLGDARSFLSAAREVALTKPIIVIKARETQQALHSAVLRTGASARSDEALDAAFRRVGVLRVDRIADLFCMAEALSRQPGPKGPRLAIVTNARGPGRLATDTLLDTQGELAQLSDETLEKLDEFLPPNWSHENPIDILGDADAQQYVQAVQTVAEDPNTDGLVVVLSPLDMAAPTETAEQLKAYARIPGKPILASWMGGPQVAAGKEILAHAQIPTFDYCDTAARVFANMWRYSYNLQCIYETATFSEYRDEDTLPDYAQAGQIIDSVRSQERTILTEAESKQLLGTYGIDAVETCVARNREEAVDHANRIGYPVVLKVHSETITYKSEAGGVRLNLMDADAVRRAYVSIEQAVQTGIGEEHFQGVTVQPMVLTPGYELIVGSTIHEQLGPVLMFGTGGRLVNVLEDRSLGLPPLNEALARRLMEQTAIYRALKGEREQKPVHLPSLERLLVRFSQLVVEQKWIKECDVNPLLVSGDSVVAVDARVVLHGLDVSEEQLPRPAIRPYPIEYVTRFAMKDEIDVTIRPIAPQDEPLVAKLQESLSDRTSQHHAFHPFFRPSPRVGHEELARVCFVDYDRQIVLVADRRHSTSGEHEILGIARLSKVPGTNHAELAVLVADAHQGQGLGTKLVELLIQFGEREHLTRISAEILPGNVEMRQVLERSGFCLTEATDTHEVLATLDLTPSGRT